MELASQVKGLAGELGADLVGVAASASLEGAPPDRRPSVLVKNARAVVVMALRVPRGAVASGNLRVYTSAAYSAEHHLNRLALNIANFLEDQGYSAVPIPADIPVDMQRGKGLIPDFSHKHAAVEAGLGEMGRSTLLLTARFGPRVRLVSLVTDAPLAPDSRETKEVCQGCYLCVEACPASALSQDGKIDIIACLRKCMPYGVGGLIRFVRDFLSAPGSEQRMQLLRDPRLLEFHQFLRAGGYACAQCVQVCPA